MKRQNISDTKPIFHLDGKWLIKMKTEKWYGSNSCDVQIFIYHNFFSCPLSIHIRIINMHLYLFLLRYFVFAIHWFITRRVVNWIALIWTIMNIILNKVNWHNYEISACLFYLVWKMLILNSSWIWYSVSLTGKDIYHSRRIINKKYLFFNPNQISTQSMYK